VRHFHYQLLRLRSSKPRREAVGCIPIQLLLHCLEGTQNLESIGGVLQRVQRLQLVQEAPPQSLQNRPRRHEWRKEADGSAFSTRGAPHCIRHRTHR
jgi:hypothetical protein